MISTLFVEKLNHLLDKDRSILLDILKTRNVLLPDNTINRELVRLFAADGIKKIQKLSRDKRIPFESFLKIMTIGTKANDPQTAFHYIFFIFSFYEYELPEILLPLAVNPEGLLEYFKSCLLFINTNQMCTNN